MFYEKKQINNRIYLEIKGQLCEILTTFRIEHEDGTETRKVASTFHDAFDVTLGERVKSVSRERSRRIEIEYRRDEMGKDMFAVETTNINEAIASFEKKFPGKRIESFLV